MPVIKVYGLPAELGESEIERLYVDMVSAIVSVEALGVTSKTVSFFFPKDLMKFGLGEDIIVFVDGLFEQPERTKAVRAETARRIGETVKQRFPDAFVECFVRPFDPQQGFWSSRPADLSKRSIDELEVSAHTYNCLSDASIGTIGDLVQRTEAELLASQRFHKKQVDEIKAVLAVMHLTLGMKLG